MQLLLWRHADALPGRPDRERPLSEKGIRQAAATAAWLNPLLPAHTRILVSPALRTRQTADALGREYDIHASLMPGSTPEAILSAANWPDSGRPVLVVGHQPLLGYLASRLLCGQQQGWHIERSNVWWFDIAGKTPDETVLKALVPPGLFSGEASPPD